MDLKNIKIIISEMDGVVTENLTSMGEMGMVMFKQYYMKDFEAINKIKSKYNFAFLSGDGSISMSLCRKRNIPFYYSERNKPDSFAQILRRYNYSPDNVLYIGCSYSDLSCMNLARLSLCPEDAVLPVKKAANSVIPLFGGTGVLCYLSDVIIDQYRIGG